MVVSIEHLMDEGTCSPAKAVEGALEGAHHVHGDHRLAASVLSVRHGVADRQSLSTARDSSSMSPEMRLFGGGWPA